MAAGERGGGGVTSSSKPTPSKQTQCHFALQDENSGRLASADLAKQTACLESKRLQMFSLIVVLFSPYFSFDHFGTHSLSCGINNTSKLKRHIVHRGTCHAVAVMVQGHSAPASESPAMKTTSCHQGFSDIDGIS